jgi:hypothetical protein
MTCPRFRSYSLGVFERGGVGECANLISAVSRSALSLGPEAQKPALACGPACLTSSGTVCFALALNATPTEAHKTWSTATIRSVVQV